MTNYKYIDTYTHMFHIFHRIKDNFYLIIFEPKKEQSLVIFCISIYIFHRMSHFDIQRCYQFNPEFNKIAITVFSNRTLV